MTPPITMPVLLDCTDPVQHIAPERESVGQTCAVRRARHSSVSAPHLPEAAALLLLGPGFNRPNAALPVDSRARRSADKLLLVAATLARLGQVARICAFERRRTAAHRLVAIRLLPAGGIAYCAAAGLGAVDRRAVRGGEKVVLSSLRAGSSSHSLGRMGGSLVEQERKRRARRSRTS